MIAAFSWWFCNVCGFNFWAGSQKPSECRGCRAPSPVPSPYTP